MGHTWVKQRFLNRKKSEVLWLGGAIARAKLDVLDLAAFTR